MELISTISSNLNFQKAWEGIMTVMVRNLIYCACAWWMSSHCGTMDKTEQVLVYILASFTSIYAYFKQMSMLQWKFKYLIVILHCCNVLITCVSINSGLISGFPILRSCPGFLFDLQMTSFILDLCWIHAIINAIQMLFVINYMQRVYVVHSFCWKLATN